MEKKKSKKVIWGLHVGFWTSLFGCLSSFFEFLKEYVKYQSNKEGVKAIVEFSYFYGYLGLFCLILAIVFAWFVFFCSEKEKTFVSGD